MSAFGAKAGIVIDNRNDGEPWIKAAAHNDRLLTASDFFSRAKGRLTFDVPAGLADPHVVPRHDQEDANPAVIAAIAAVRPIRPAAVLVPIVERDEPSVLLTQRTAHLVDHAGQISFPGGKIDAGDGTPTAAALREAEEEIALPSRFVEPLGYLDIHLTPWGHRIVPVLARVQPGFALRLNRDEVDDAFEVPLAFLMTPQSYKRESRDWNGLTLNYYVIPFGDRKIWGATAFILRNLYERVYRAWQCIAGKQCPLLVVESTGRRNTLSHSFCWGLNPKVLHTLPATPKSPFSLPQWSLENILDISSYTPSFPIRIESVASTGWTGSP
jgi:8-oxo-dGTP pyrophosphatase MutT (NUDIX family)